jgi:hypothetical protein
LEGKKVYCISDGDHPAANVPKGLPEIVEVQSGDNYTCSLGVNKRMYCWGNLQAAQFEIPSLSH